MKFYLLFDGKRYGPFRNPGAAQVVARKLRLTSYAIQMITQTWEERETESDFRKAMDNILGLLD